MICKGGISADTQTDKYVETNMLFMMVSRDILEFRIKKV